MEWRVSRTADITHVPVALPELVVDLEQRHRTEDPEVVDEDVDARERREERGGAVGGNVGGRGLEARAGLFDPQLLAGDAPGPVFLTEGPDDALYYATTAATRSGTRPLTCTTAPHPASRAAIARPLSRPEGSPPLRSPVSTR
jgi:hypothetical protein